MENSYAWCLWLRSYSLNWLSTMLRQNKDGDAERRMSPEQDNECGFILTLTTDRTWLKIGGGSVRQHLSRSRYEWGGSLNQADRLEVRMAVIGVWLIGNSDWIDRLLADYSRGALPCPSWGNTKLHKSKGLMYMALGQRPPPYWAERCLTQVKCVLHIGYQMNPAMMDDESDVAFPAWIL